MKTMKLSFAALALVALTQATGCIIFTDDGPDTGVFRTTWSLTQGGNAVTCGSVGAVTVAFLSTEVGTANGFDDKFDCVDMAGDTAPLPLADYTVSVDILDSAEAPLNPAPANLSSGFDVCDLEEGNACVVRLPNVEFAFQ